MYIAKRRSKKMTRRTTATDDFEQRRRRPAHGPAARGMARDHRLSPADRRQEAGSKSAK